MEKQNSIEALEEMNEFLSTAADTASGENSADDDGLPFEPLDAFNTDPIDFGEMSERMLRKVEDVFDLTRMYNRQSTKYLKACAILEKGIKYLAVCCLTRIALKLHDHPYPNLEQLTTQKLYGMVSGNFRKLDDALTEKQQQAYDLYPDLMDMHTRYFNLLLRLRSTEDKIYRFHFQKYYEKENYTPVVEGLAFTEKSWARSYTSKREEPPAFRKAPAFPMPSYSNIHEISKQKDSLSADLSIAAKNTGSAETKKGKKHTNEPGSAQITTSRLTSAPESAEDSGKETALSGPADPAPLLPEAGEANTEASGETQNSSITAQNPPEGTKSPEPSSAVLPAFYEILQKVMDRRRETADGSLNFTFEEMQALAADPEFARFDPGMFREIRRILTQIDSG